MDIRADAIFGILQNKEPDVVCFQEVCASTFILHALPCLCLPMIVLLIPAMSHGNILVYCAIFGEADVK